MIKIIKDHLRNQVADGVIVGDAKQRRQHERVVRLGLQRASYCAATSFERCRGIVDLCRVVLRLENVRTATTCAVTVLFNDTQLIVYKMKYSEYLYLDRIQPQSHCLVVALKLRGRQRHKDLERKAGARVRPRRHGRQKQLRVSIECVTEAHAQK